MAVHHYDKTVRSEETYVSNVSIGDLIEAARLYLGDSDATWRVEDDAVVFERPVGTTLTGREA